MAMKLNTGKVAFAIEFDNGDKQNIYFNPVDTDLPIRLKNFQARITEKLKQYEGIGFKNSGEPKEFDLIDSFNAVRVAMCDELDIAFGGEISSVVFKHCSPFAIVNGQFFIVQFLEAIRPEIEKHIKKASDDVAKKMAKHINKYSK